MKLKANEIPIMANSPTVITAVLLLFFFSSVTSAKSLSSTHQPSIPTKSSHPPWPVLPDEFSIQFYFGKDNFTDGPMPAPDSTWYYSWTLGYGRVDHGPGNYECAHFYGTNESQSCTLLFDNHVQIMYVIIPSEQICCPSMNISLPPPNFIENGEWAGEHTLFEPTIVCNAWDKGEMRYLTVADGPQVGLPVRMGPMDMDSVWDFQPSTMKVGAQDKSLFVLPDYCTDVCPQF